MNLFFNVHFLFNISLSISSHLYITSTFLFINSFWIKFLHALLTPISKFAFLNIHFHINLSYIYASKFFHIELNLTKPDQCSMCTHLILFFLAMTHQIKLDRKNLVLVIIIVFQVFENFLVSFRICQYSFFQNFGNGKLGIRSKAGITNNFEFWILNFEFLSCHTEKVIFKTSQYHFFIHQLDHCWAWVSNHHLCGGK